MLVSGSRVRVQSVACAVLMAVGGWLTAPGLDARQAPQRRPGANVAGLEARTLGPLVKAVDRAASDQTLADGAVLALEAPAGASALGAAAQPVAISWDHAALKSGDRKVYIPFVLGVDAKALPSNAVSAYVRVVDSTGASAYEQDFAADFRSGGAGQPSRLARAIAVPGGTYDVFVALRFAAAKARPADLAAPAEATAVANPDHVYVLRKRLTVEDLWATNLTTSTVLVADRLEALKSPLAPAALAERPFIIGAAEIVPSYDRSFRKTEDLTVFFQVYNAVLGSDHKPRVSVEYVFERAEGEAFTTFKRVPTQHFNAQTLPPNFDVDEGHQLSAGWAVPLASFPVGDYRLTMTIADALAGTTITRAVSFNVAGS